MDIYLSSANYQKLYTLAKNNFCSALLVFLCSSSTAFSENIINIMIMLSKFGRACVSVLCVCVCISLYKTKKNPQNRKVISCTTLISFKLRIIEVRTTPT